MPLTLFVPANCYKWNKPKFKANAIQHRKDYKLRTRDGIEFWVLCECYLKAAKEYSVGACAATQLSINEQSLIVTAI